MGSNADSTNSKQLPTFSSIKPYEQLAVVLRSEGKTAEQTVNQINAEYELAYKANTVRDWFMAGGRLEAAYMEYLEWLADQSVREAKLKIKRLSATAADTLEEIMKDANGPVNVRQQAAKTVLGKYIPDRQIIVDEAKTDELPDSLADDADAIAAADDKPPEEPKETDKTNGADDGSKQVDDPPESQQDHSGDREGSGEALPAQLLSESETTDRSGDAPA
jgi:hypothetical protein